MSLPLRPRDVSSRALRQMVRSMERVSTLAVAQQTHPGCLKKSIGTRQRKARSMSRRTHGLSYSPTYIAWQKMKNRCTNPNYYGYKHWGGRGIKICERWNDFLLFLEDMGEKPTGTSLDRIDNNGDYEPGNCRWASRKEQNRNTSRTRTVVVFGVAKSASEWAEETVISVHTIYSRLQRGYSPEEAIMNTDHRLRGLNS